MMTLDELKKIRKENYLRINRTIKAIEVLGKKQRLFLNQISEAEKQYTKDNVPRKVGDKVMCSHYHFGEQVCNPGYIAGISVNNNGSFTYEVGKLKKNGEPSQSKGLLAHYANESQLKPYE